MAIIQLEGVDRSGKTTIANKYKELGYEIIHMSAPDKKYTEPGYTGPSFLDDLIEMYLSFIDKDVVIDRTEYGEAFIWPSIFGRQPLLDEDDILVLSDLLNTMDVHRYLLVPKDKKAHWERCVANNEQINRRQFELAYSAYDNLHKEHGFVKTTMDEMCELLDKNSEQDQKLDDTNDQPEEDISSGDIDTASSTADLNDVGQDQNNTLSESNVTALQRANAINSILQKKIVTKKGDEYKQIDSEIRGFLQKQLDSLFTPMPDDSLSTDEVQILKVFCDRLKQKQQKVV